MVALHNNKLTSRDIWPDLPWTDEQVLSIRRKIRDNLVASGIGGLDLPFYESREWVEYMSKFPSFAERCRIMKLLYPVKSSSALQLTDEEKQYIVDRIRWSNDPIAEDIILKLVGTL